jgi:hypothetical protein
MGAMSSSTPPWLSDLSGDETLGARLGLQWLDDERRTTLRAQALELVRGCCPEGEWLEQNLARLTRSTPIASGPERRKRLRPEVSSTALFFDPELPSRLLLSLSASMSPLTWASAPATREGLEELFARYLSAESSPVQRLPMTYRCVMEFGEVDREQLEGVLERSPYLDDAGWCSGSTDDPWERWGGDVHNVLQLTVQVQDARKEAPGRFPSVSHRALFSGSVLKVEQHPFGLWVVEVRYAPAQDGPAVEAVRSAFDAHLPLDLPVDVLESRLFYGGHFCLAHARELEALADGFDAYVVAARLAVESSEPRTALWLRSIAERFSGDTEALGVIADAAARYGHMSVVGAISLLCPEGSDLSEAILRRMRPAPPSSESDPDDPDSHADPDDDEDQDA